MVTRYDLRSCALAAVAATEPAAPTGHARVRHARGRVRARVASNVRARHIAGISCR